ncbi:hypothetical protein OIU77_001570 [Salix suchowensis]|uniref:Uncharacterized protein n=1 Tax=Salix suchowensis TaxID=1278906 RepID=A0ABQ9B4V7_9ROSI|nr:hypothetical protein OIU77_001570 [Salix suchowensis]
MASIMDQQSPYTTFQRRDEPEFNLREWAFRAQLSGENTTISRSRRFSGSNIRSFGEDARSFRSNITISSTASSPGYSLRDEIDPSTYSFTAALRALQARSGYYNIWECSSPDGFALNSKWNEAEKYIRNPLSGEVPMECLSAKTLNKRLLLLLLQIDDIANHFPIKEDKMEGKLSTRDVGTQSTPPDVSSSSSPCPAAPTPPIREGKRCEVEDEDSPNCNSKMEARVQLKDEEEARSVCVSLASLNR